MIRKGLLSALVFVFVLGAGQAAAQFLASDLIYLAAVTHTNGDGESRWRSDVFITNVDDVDIDIAINNECIIVVDIIEELISCENFSSVREKPS